MQGRSAPAIDALLADAAALEGAGAAALVLEGIPREVAAQITARATIPTIGIGAGPDCDGQILVFHDLAALTFSKSAKFVRSFGDAGSLLRAAIASYRDEVVAGTFPNDAESYHLPSSLREEMDISRDPVQA